MVLTPVYLIHVTSSDAGDGSAANPAAESIFNALVFGLALFWFAFNGLRWLQERLLPPVRWLLFATFAIAACALGGIAIFLAAADIVDSDNLADAGVSGEVNQIAIGSAAIAFGVIAAVGSMLVYLREADPATVRIK